MRVLSSVPLPAVSERQAIADRWAAIEARIAEACRRRGRPLGSVRVVAASKGQPLERMTAAFQCGVLRFGENRVQEALRKAPLLPQAIEWHCLGPLQTNKVRAALGLFRVFHAIDRVRIGEALDQEAKRQGRTVEGLIEVNIGGEPTKHGFSPEFLREQVAPLARLEHLRLVGLMTIPPPTPDPEAARPYFRQLRELAQSLQSTPEWKGRLVELSMGMSDDFEVAIEEGATYVRIGTALFGPRGAAASESASGDRPSG